jgi:hypothetical protein
MGINPGKIPQIPKPVPPAVHVAKATAAGVPMNNADIAEAVEVGVPTPFVANCSVISFPTTETDGIILIPPRVMTRTF